MDQATESRKENRRRLALATAEYYESLSPEEIAEESLLAESMREAANRICFDREP